MLIGWILTEPRAPDAGDFDRLSESLCASLPQHGRGSLAARTTSVTFRRTMKLRECCLRRSRRVQVTGSSSAEHTALPRRATAGRAHTSLLHLNMINNG
jgi:hypothetical protein